MQEQRIRLKVEEELSDFLSGGSQSIRAARVFAFALGANFLILHTIGTYSSTAEPYRSPAYHSLIGQTNVAVNRSDNINYANYLMLSFSCGTAY